MLLNKEFTNYKL
jgi:hypothetical protein